MFKGKIGVRRRGSKFGAVFLKRGSILHAVQHHDPGGRNIPDGGRQGSQGDIRALVVEVRRIGGNINQAVKLAQTMKTRKNFFGRPVNYDRELAQVWAEVKRLVELLESVMKRP